MNKVRLPDDSFINSAHEYFRVSSEGEVLERYGEPSTSTLEDCLYAMDIHAVIRSSLYAFFWTECYGHPGELEAKMLLQNLEAVTEKLLPFNPVEIVETFHLRQSD